MKKFNTTFTSIYLSLFFNKILIISLNYLPINPININHEMQYAWLFNLLTNYYLEKKGGKKNV